MSKYTLFLILILVSTASTGCETVKGASTGAANGLSQDMHNAADPDKNGWNAIEKADAWMRENMW